MPPVHPGAPPRPSPAAPRPPPVPCTAPPAPSPPQNGDVRRALRSGPDQTLLTGGVEAAHDVGAWLDARAREADVTGCKVTVEFGDGRTDTLELSEAKHLVNASMAAAAAAASDGRSPSRVELVRSVRVAAAPGHGAGGASPIVTHCQRVGDTLSCISTRQPGASWAAALSQGAGGEGRPTHPGPGPEDTLVPPAQHAAASRAANLLVASLEGRKARCVLPPFPPSPRVRHSPPPPPPVIPRVCPRSWPPRPRGRLASAAR